MMLFRSSAWRPSMCTGVHTLFVIICFNSDSITSCASVPRSRSAFLTDILNIISPVPCLKMSMSLRRRLPSSVGASPEDRLARGMSPCVVGRSPGGTPLCAGAPSPIAGSAEEWSASVALAVVAHTPCKDYRVSDTVRLYRVRKGPCSDNNTG